MKSIKILSGGFLTEIPIIHSELVKQNNKLLEINKEFYDSKTLNFTVSKLNNMKQLTILKTLVNEYQNEIAYDKNLILSYEKDINSIKIEQNKEILVNKYSELKKIKLRLSKFCSDIEEKNDLLRIKIIRTLDKEENKKLDKFKKVDEEYAKQLKIKIELESELASGQKLTSDEITILEGKIKCKKETNDKKESVQKSIDDKQKILDRIINFIDENLDIDKLNDKLQEYKEKDKSIILLLDKNDKYILFTDIINYLNKNPIYAETDIKKEKNIATYPSAEDIKCDGLDFNGKFIGWFISQRNKILKEYGKETNDKKISEFCSKIELINELKDINITEGDYKSRYNRLNYELLTKDHYKNYEQIFDLLSVYSSWSDNNFSGLYEKNADGSLKNFIIYEKKDMYIPEEDTVVNYPFEIFRSSPTILPTDNFYEFKKSTYQFKLLPIDINRIESKQIVYPVFNNIKNEFVGSLIDGLIIYTNFKEIDKLLRYYKHIFEIKIFDKWINSYGVFLDDIQFIPHTSPIILNIFILANCFNIYFDILLNLNYKIGYLNDVTKISIITIDENIDENSTYLEITESINIDDYTEYIEEIKKELMSIKNLNTENEDILTEKIIELLKNIVIKHKTIKIEGIILIINKLKEIDALKQLIFNLINSFIFIFLKIDNYQDILTNTYNFSKLNYLFSLFKKDFNDQGKFNSRMSDFNSFVSLSKNQVGVLFFIELVYESICFFKTWWIPNVNMSSKHSEIEDKSVFIFNKKCLLDIVCSFYFVQIYDNAKVSSLINYKSQFVNFNHSLGQIEYTSDIKNSYIKLGVFKPTGNKVIFNKLYESIFSKSLDGFKLQLYTEPKLYYSFDDPRGLSSLTKQGRPMCGEITIMNLLNYLLFNKQTKSIDFNYLPEITTRENKDLTDFYTKYSNILEYNKNDELISKFFKLLINIPFEIITGIDDITDYDGSYDRDYGDHNIPCVYRYNKFTNINSEGKMYIQDGTELRVTYFNLLRILSFILKLDGVLELRNIEANKDNNEFLKNGLKEIIKLFRNPNRDKIVEKYDLDFEKDEEIYKYYSPINVKIEGANISLAGHSVFTLFSGKDFKKIKKILTNYDTILNKIPYTKERPVDIYSSIFFAIFKENNIYSEINFNYLPEEYIIKFLNILHVDFDDLYISTNIIKSLIQFKKSNILTLIYNKFRISKHSYSYYLEYVFFNHIEIDINEFIKKYFLKFRQLTDHLFSLIIEYNDIDIVKGIIDSKKNIMNYSLSSIKTQEMFNLLDSVINPLFNKPKFYLNKIRTSTYFNKPFKFTFINNILFKKIIKRKPAFFRTFYFETMNNNTINFFEALSLLNPETIKSLYPPEKILENIKSYELLKIIKSKYDFYIENESILTIIVSNTYKNLLLPSKFKINEQIDMIKLLCFVAESNKTIFLETFLCESYESIKRDKHELFKSERHIYTEYLNHKFYDQFSSIFNSLNIYSKEYYIVCINIFFLLSFKMNSDILKTNFKKIKTVDESEIMKKIIEEYPKLYKRNMENYSPNMFKLYGTTYFEKIRGIFSYNIKMFTPEFLFKSYLLGKINEELILIAYDGTDEFTDFLITQFTTDKINRIPIFRFIVSNYLINATDDQLNKLFELLIKKDEKYTKDYICKNFSKLLNTVIARINDSSPLKVDWQTTITKLIHTISISDKFLIKCLKNIIKSDKLIVQSDIGRIKNILDKKIKTILDFNKFPVDPSNLKDSAMLAFKDDNLLEIFKKLKIR